MMDKDDLIIIEALEDVLRYHQIESEDMSEVEHLAETINYALDKFLSLAIKTMKEGEQ
jgi:hypothetical protein